MRMTLKTVDLQVILPRMDQAARYQDREKQQVHLRHQFALQEQKQHGEKTHQVPLLDRGEASRFLTEQEMNGRKRRNSALKKKKPAKSNHPRGQDPHRGSKLDLWI